MELDDASLILFFTQGISLQTWANVGNIDRELELYKRLAKHIKQVSIVTYGGKSDLKFSNNVGEIQILPTTWNNKRIITNLRLLIKYYSKLKKASVLKTNQILGSEIPLWIKKRFKQKVIVRCGYLYSKFTYNKTENKIARMKASKLERDAFYFADFGVVTSSRDRDYIITKYELDSEKIRVIPNFVITDLFKPLPDTPKIYDLIFIGRGDKQKNLENLLEAINYLDKTRKKKIALAMVGGCCFNIKIQEIIENYHLNVTLKGNLPNFDLPEVINHSKIFILPSYYEGHPKALLEAMSCGIPCIGADVVGIQDDLEHLITGYVCKTDYRSIAAAINSLLSDESLQTKLGKNARKYVLNNYSIDKILKLETSVIKELIS